MEMNSEIEECILQDPNGIYKRPQRSKEELDIILSKFTESHFKQASEAYENMITKFNEKISVQSRKSLQWNSNISDIFSKLHYKLKY